MPFPYSMEQRQLMLPLGLYDPIRRKLRPDLRPGKPPVRAVPVFFLIEGEVLVPPLKKGHKNLCKAEEKIKLRRKIAGLQYMVNVPPHVDCFGGIVVKGETPLILCDPVRQKRGPENDAFLLKVALVPGKRIIVDGVSSKQVAGPVRIQQMIHEEDVIHIPFVENSQIVDLFIVREQIFYRVKDLCPLTDLRDNKKLRHIAFRKNETGLPVRIDIRKLLHESPHIRVLCRRPGTFNRLSGALNPFSGALDQFSGALNQFFRGIPIWKVRPGKLHKEAVILIFLIFFPEIPEILLPGLVILQECVKRRERCHFMVLRIPFPKHFDPVKRKCQRSFFVNRRVKPGLTFTSLSSAKFRFTGLKDVFKKRHMVIPELYAILRYVYSTIWTVWLPAHSPNAFPVQCGYTASVCFWFVFTDFCDCVFTACFGFVSTISLDT